MSYFNLIETDGIFRTQEEIDNYKNKDGKQIQPGHNRVMYVTKTGTVMALLMRMTNMM